MPSWTSDSLHLRVDKTMENFKYRLEAQNSFGYVYSNEVSVSLVTLLHTGTCGNGITWSCYDGVLVISGTGAMENYEKHGETPWKAIREQIQSVVISEGISTISEGAFF